MLSFVSITTDRTIAPSDRPAKRGAIVKKKSAGTSATVTLDPRLSFSENGHTSLPDHDQPDFGGLPTFSTPSIIFQPRVLRPRLHIWSTQRPTSFDAILVDYPCPPALSPGHDSSPFAPLAAPAAMMRTMIHRDVSGADEEGPGGMTQLKGVLWPGMDLFDAATPERKRRRNQKKETSVIERLERYALDVDPNELIFTPRGSLYKERPITGQVDFNSSPYKMDHFTSPPAPPPKRRAAAVRVPLASKDTNRLLAFTKNDSITDTHKAAVTKPDRSAPSNPAAKTAKKPKRKLAVFRDQDEVAAEEAAPATKTIRLLTASISIESQPLQHTAASFHQALDQPYASLYQPAYQHRFLTDAFESFPQHFHTMPVSFPIYGRTTGQDIPGFFSMPPQYHGLSALQDVRGVGDNQALPGGQGSDFHASIGDEED